MAKEDPVCCQKRILFVNKRGSCLLPKKDRGCCQGILTIVKSSKFIPEKKPVCFHARFLYARRGSSFCQQWILILYFLQRILIFFVFYFCCATVGYLVDRRILILPEVHRVYHHTKLYRYIIVYTVENRIFAVSSPSNTRQNQFMLLQITRTL